MQSKFKVFSKIYFLILSYNFFFLNDANGQIDNNFVCIEKGTKDFFFVRCTYHFIFGYQETNKTITIICDVVGWMLGDMCVHVTTWRQHKFQ